MTSSRINLSHEEELRNRLTHHQREIRFTEEEVSIIGDEIRERHDLSELSRNLVDITEKIKAGTIVAKTIGLPFILIKQSMNVPPVRNPCWCPGHPIELLVAYEVESRNLQEDVNGFALSELKVWPRYSLYGTGGGFRRRERREITVDTTSHYQFFAVQLYKT
ncbi:MAG: hypothetical protein AABY07_07110 [Nanoarchaeota archaeon]